MRPIDKFILHVVHNWENELNEAYSDKAVQGFINKFKEEADDLNININDIQLKNYIKTFDRIKEKLPGDQRDLNKWSLSKFIKLVTATKPKEGELETSEEIDITPDVVYHNDDNSIVIYNGSKQDNCVTYGRGERWCITKGSFPNYRYSPDRSYPTFYLAKNNNLSDSDKLSFVAIQVRDPQSTTETNRYVYTNRQNSPHESSPMNFERLLREIPWLNDIPNIKSILKYIPLSSEETITQKYKSNPISYLEWSKLPYPVKEQYLVIRKGQALFRNITNEEFVEKHLIKFPELAKFVAETPNVIDSVLLLKNLDKFPNQIRRSITANLQQPVLINLLPEETLPFDVKKLLVQLDKWRLKSDERLYVNKEGDTIVKLTLGDDIEVGLYQEDDNYPSIKLNKRTSKYLLDYPELDKIPLKNLLKLSADEIIDNSLINKILDNAESDPNSALVIKPTESGKIILDSNSFSSYKIENGKVKPLPFGDEEVQQVFADSKDNDSIQQNSLKLFQDDKGLLPNTIDKEGLISVIKSIPFNKRRAVFNNTNSVLLTADGDIPFFAVAVDPREPRFFVNAVRSSDPTDWREFDRTYAQFNEEMFKSYFTYLRQINKSFDDNELLGIFKISPYSAGIRTKKNFVKANPPVNTNNRYKPVMNGDTALLINTANPRESIKISDNSGKAVKANIPSALARQLLGGVAGSTPGAGNVVAPTPQVRRRGRPVGGGVPRQAAAAPDAGGGTINVSNRMEEIGLEAAFLRLPRSDYRRLNVTNATRVNPNGDRGAARRNNQLGDRGNVTSVISIGASKIYFIRLANNQTIASINVQPGNRNYVLFGNNQGNVALSLNSPSELLSALQQRGLAEVHQYLVNEYLDANPTHLTEFKQLLRKHINEKKNEQK